MQALSNFFALRTHPLYPSSPVCLVWAMQTYKKNNIFRLFSPFKACHQVPKRMIVYLIFPLHPYKHVWA